MISTSILAATLTIELSLGWAFIVHCAGHAWLAEYGRRQGW